jgi:hypothetical protein
VSCPLVFANSKPLSTFGTQRAYAQASIINNTTTTNNHNDTHPNKTHDGKKLQKGRQHAARPRTHTRHQTERMDRSRPTQVLRPGGHGANRPTEQGTAVSRLRRTKGLDGEGHGASYTVEKEREDGLGAGQVLVRKLRVVGDWRDMLG